MSPVTLTLMVTKQTLQKTLWLMMMYQHGKFGYKKSFSSEDIVQTFNEDLNLHYDLDREHSKEVQKL